MNDTPTNVRRRILWLGFGVSWLLYVHRYVFALIKTDLKTEFSKFGIPEAEHNEMLGYLQAGFSASYGLFQVPAGMVIDFFGAHLFLTASIVVWSLGFGLLALAHSTTVMYVSRYTLGIGQSGVLAGIGRLTKVWFPADSRSSAQGLLGVTASRGGAFCCYLLFPLAMTYLFAESWQTAVLGLASAGLIWAFVFYLKVRNTPADHPACNAAEVALIQGDDINDKPSSNKRMGVMQLLRSASGWGLFNAVLIALAASFSTVADAFYSSWMPQFLEESHDLEKKLAGLYSALPLIGGMVGGIIGGLLGDRLVRRNNGSTTWARRITGCVGKGSAAVLVCVSLLVIDQPLMFALVLCAAKIGADISLATRWAAVTDIGGPVIATLFALTNAAAIGAGIVGSFVYGKIVPDMESGVAPEPAAWYPVLYVVIGMYVLCSLTWLIPNTAKPLFEAKRVADDNPFFDYPESE